MARHRLIIIVLLLFVALDGIDGQLEAEIIEQATEAYETGDYATAITLYAELITEGIETAQVYTNLAHAYYQDGQLGFALLNYRRAERLSPRSDLVDEYIARIRGERVDYQRDARNWLDRLAESTQGLVTLHELRWGAGVLWAIFFSLATCWLWIRRWRDRLRLVLVIAGTLVLIVVSLVTVRTYVTDNRPAAVLTELSEQVMSGPGERYLPLYTLYTAAEMRILERRGEWVRFVLPDRREGWLPAESIRVV